MRVSRPSPSALHRVALFLVYLLPVMTDLPLFPLNTVLFPSTPLSLHIFEERYRLMVSRCIAEEIPFGVVYHHGEQLEQIGCTARIDRVLTRYEDGRMDIVTIGQQRFSIEVVDRTRPYLQALVRLLDHDDDPDSTGAIDATLATDALLRYAYYANLEIDRDALEELNASDVSYLIASVDEIGMETKQRILETDDVGLRLAEAVAALETVTEQLLVTFRLKAAIGDDVDMGSIKN